MRNLILAGLIVWLVLCGGLGLLQGWAGQAASAVTQKGGEIAVSVAKTRAKEAVSITPIPITAKYVLGKIQGGSKEGGWFGSVVTETVQVVEKTYGKDYRAGTVVGGTGLAAQFADAAAKLALNAVNGNVVRLTGNVYVQAGVNIKQLRETDIRISSVTGSVTICLPDAQVISSHFDNTPGSTRTEIQGVLQHGDQDVGTAARAMAEVEAAAAAIRGESYVTDKITVTADPNRRILVEAAVETQNGIRSLLLMTSDLTVSSVRTVSFSTQPCR